MELDPHVELLESAYEAFNGRDIDGVIAHMHPAVTWPTDLEGGHVHGHDGVRSYWTRQWTATDPRVTLKRFDTRRDGRIVVTVHQIARDSAGNTQVETARHAYEIERGLIRRMQILD